MNERIWKAQPKQRIFLKRTEDEAFIGGSAGGGKSDALLAFSIYRRLKYPGSKGLILRRTYAELEKEGSLIPRSHELLTGVGTWNGSTRKWTFPQELGSGVIEFGYCQYERDVYQYQSAQYDDISFDELTHFTLFQYLYLIGRCRTIREDLKPLIRAASNPGNVGHAWVKKRFIDAMAPMSTYTDENQRTRYFVPAKLSDNQILMKADPLYEQRLRQLPERERLALLDGRWDLYEGQFLSEFDYGTHVVSCETRIDDWWTRFGAYDHGFNHPYCFGWYAVDGDGNVYKYRELMDRHKRPDQIAAAVHEFKDTKDLRYIVSGHDAWSKQRDGGPEIAEQFLKLGDTRLVLSRANIDRTQGASQLRDYLAHEDMPEGRKGPRFFIFENCVHTIECLPRMIHDPKNVEDVLKVDATEDDMYAGDDPYDETRYALMSRPPLSIEPTEQPVLYGSEWWKDQHNKARKSARKYGIMIPRA